jgi:uncharacterized caspase-like protein
MRWLCLMLLGSCFAALPQDRRIVPASPATSSRRVALVIGNRDYLQQPLVNPVNDATDLDKTLRALGFETKLALNLDRRALDSALNSFSAGVKPGDTALFYFSGHGMEVDGQNYLLPVDFSAQAESDTKYEALAAGQVQERLQARGARTIIMIPDACRNNPWKGSRGTGGGLAGMSGSGVYVAFAAGPGSTADDNRSERNGRFTKHLLASITQPGLSIDDVFNRVRENVAAETGGRQVPFSNSGLIGGFSFREPVPALPAPVVPKTDAAAEAWALVKDSHIPEDFEDFAKSFPASDLAAAARFRATQLRRAAAPAVEARMNPAPSPVPAGGSKPVLEGEWRGTLSTATQSLPLFLELAPRGKGTLRSPAQNKDLAMQLQYAVNGNRVTITISSKDVQGGSASYSALVNADEMTGTWSQLGMSLPLTFTRTAQH